MSSKPCFRGVTLIEVLVASAMIVPVGAMFAPTLARSREVGRMKACQSNLGQLVAAFGVYAQGYSGHLPGNCQDPGADWLGIRNAPSNRQPEDGTIYPLVGQRKSLYNCPSDDCAKSAGLTFFKESYTMSLLMSGAKAEWISGAHYRSTGFSAADHRTDTPSLQGAPALVEEDWNYYQIGSTGGTWENDDCVTQRHLGQFGNIAYHDGSVGTVSLPATPHVTGKYVGSMSVCIRTRGKWVSGRAWSDAVYGSLASPKGAYGFLERAQPADKYSILH